MNTAGAAQDQTPINAVMRSITIIKSVISNDVEGVQEALEDLEEGHTIDQLRGPGGMTMLHVAAGCGAADVTKVLIAGGMDPLVSTDNGISPLDIAHLAGHHDIVAILVAAGADITITNRDGQTASAKWNQALYDAIVEGDVEVVQAFATPERVRGMDTLLFDDDGTTLLYHAIRGGDPKIVRLLLDHGASPTQEAGADERLSKPIALAQHLRNFKIENILRDAMAELDKDEDANASEGRIQALSEAIEKGDLDAAREHATAARVQALDKAMFEMIDGDGPTLMHVAVERGNPEIVRLLLDHGVSATREGTINDGRWTMPLERAVERGDQGIVAVLRERGAFLDTDDEQDGGASNASAV